jgi:hypothetical protein
VTATVDHIAPVVPLRRTPRTRAPRAASPLPDDRTRLIAESNRLLDLQATELSARDALGELVGVLLGAAGKSLPEPAVLAAVRRTADKLACPPADAPPSVRKALESRCREAAVTTLVDTLMDAEQLLSDIVTAIGDAKTTAGTSRFEAVEAHLHSLVEDLVAEHDIAVTR